MPFRVGSYRWQTHDFLLYLGFICVAWPRTSPGTASTLLVLNERFLFLVELTQNRLRKKKKKHKIIISTHPHDSSPVASALRCPSGVWFYRQPYWTTSTGTIRTIWLQLWLCGWLQVKINQPVNFSRTKNNPNPTLSNLAGVLVGRCAGTGGGRGICSARGTAGCGTLKRNQTTHILFAPIDSTWDAGFICCYCSSNLKISKVIIQFKSIKNSN